jgi:16S rRNA (adenine1518-N6/adenine1519-N6)-dimethyltransferase
MSYLSVFVQFHAAVRIAFVVPRDAFEPAPEVDSAVVVIEPVDPMGEQPRLSTADEESLWRLVQAGFRERRKMLRNVLVRQLLVPGVKIDAALAECGIEGERRPQTLSVDEWLALRVALGPLPEALSPAETAAIAQSARSRAASIGAKKGRR